MRDKSVKQLTASLRKQGYSYSYINKKTGITKSTLSSWLGNIPYSPNAEMVAKIGSARAASGKAHALKKLASIQTAQALAKREVGLLTKRDLFMFGLGLYLGEGSKTHDNVRIVNSDPRVIAFAVRWFQDIGVPLESISITVHLYPDSSIQECLQFWSRNTTIPLRQFRKTSIDWRKGKKSSNQRKLPYGTADVCVRSRGRKEHGVFLSRKILGWLEASLSEALSKSRD